MARIGVEFKDVGLKRIQFITVPWQYAPADPNRVEWLPDADELWEKVSQRRASRAVRQGLDQRGRQPDRRRRRDREPERDGDRVHEFTVRVRHREPDGGHVLAVGFCHGRVGRRDAGRGPRSGGALRVIESFPNRSGSAGADWSRSSATRCLDTTSDERDPRSPAGGRGPR